MNDLITVIPTIPEVKFSVDPAKINKIIADYPLSDIPNDLAEKDNYDLCVKAIRICRESRGSITKDHKALKAPFIKAGKTCDTAKNTMLSTLQEHENAWKKAKQDHDDIEKLRLEAEAKAKQEATDAILTKISWVGQYPSRLISKTSGEVYEAIVLLKSETFDWCGDYVDSAKNTVSGVIDNLENLHKMKVDNENAERIAEEKRIEREAEEAKVAKERAIEQKRIDEERAQMEKEKAALQADKDRLQAKKDKVEAEKLEAVEEVKRLKAEKLEADERVKQEAIDAKLKSEQEAKAEKERVAKEKADKLAKKKQLKAEKAEAKKLKEEISARRQETITTLADILRSDMPPEVLANEVLGRVEAGDVPNMFFK